MDDTAKIAFLERWLALVFPSYLRYMHMLERNRIWMDRFPLEARVQMERLLDEQTAYCQKLADALDDLNALPELSPFPEDAARLNYLEMAVAIKKSLERMASNLAALKADRRQAARDESLAELLEEGIELTERQMAELEPLAADFSSNR